MNDRNARTVINGEHHLLEEYGWAGEALAEYVNQGWEVKQIIPIVDPADKDEANFLFYKGGIGVYMEREV